MAKYYSSVGTDGWGIRSYLDVTRTETATQETFVIDFGLQPTKEFIPTGWTATGTLSGNVEWQTHSKKITSTPVAINAYFKVGTITVVRDRYAGKTRAFTINWEGYLSGGTNAIKATYSFTIPALPTYTITLKKDNTASAANLVTQTKTHGVTLTLSTSKPTKTGYTFSSWNTNTNGTGTNYTSGGSFTANSTTTLYPKWTPITYTVKYNANGGSGAPANQTKTHGVTLKLSSIKPTRTNYNFVSWNTNTDGSGNSYNPEANYTANSAVTLYAQWEERYSPPKINNLTAYRVNATSGQMDEEGVYAKVVFDWTAGISGNNSVSPTSAIIKWKKTSDLSYSNSVTINNLSNSVNTTIGSSSILDIGYQYDIEVSLQITGKNPVIRTTYVSTAAFIIDINTEGNAVGIGMAAPDNITGSNSQLHIKSRIYCKDDITVEKNNDASRIQVKSNNNGEEVAFGQLSTSTAGSFGLYDQLHGKWLIHSDTDGRLYLSGINLPRVLNVNAVTPSSVGWTPTYITIDAMANYSAIGVRFRIRTTSDIQIDQMLYFPRPIGHWYQSITWHNGTTYVRGRVDVDWDNNKVGVALINGTIGSAYCEIQQIYGLSVL